MSKSSWSTILVVDDNLGARRSIEALLAQEDYRFLLADSGATALQLLAEQTPDVILLDVMMPGMNGFEACQKIRSMPRVSEIPIIMITALDDEESMIQGIDAGADDFLSKPISKIELRSRIRSILRLNRFRKLCDERQKFEVVVAQSQHGYVVLGADKQINFSNAAARSMLFMGSTPDPQASFFESARQRFSIQPANVEELLDDHKRGQPIEPFILVRSSQNEQQARWIRVTFQNLGFEHGPQQLLRLEDISDRIVSFQEKHTFSRMISHKLLTPLNAIKAAHQLIQSPEHTPARLAQISEIQKKGIERLEYDVHSILNFLERERRPDTPLSISATKSHIQQIADASPFSFSVSAKDDFAEGATINISSHSFEVCIREIVENALKFHKGDAVVVHSSILRSDDGKDVEYVFQSNSHPLSRAELANAWKPYWQADRYLTGEIPGMGLGLSLIAANVWSAGGSCKIENDSQADGVRLSLSFPIVAE